MPDPKSLTIHLVESLDDSYGGPARSVPYTAFHSTAPGSVHVLLSCDGPEARNTLIDRLGLEWTKVDQLGPSKIRFSPGLVRHLLRTYRATQGRVCLHLHNNWNFVALAAYLFSFLPRASLIISPRGSLDTWSLTQGSLRKTIAGAVFVRPMFRRAAVVHVTAEHERAAVESYARPRKIAQIPNGIEIAENTRLDLPRDLPAVLFLSRIHEKKGLDILLRAWARVDQPADARLIVAGEFANAHYRQVIEDLIAELGLENVEFVGQVDTASRLDLMNRCGLFALTSHAENFGISICEALICGMPVLVSVHTPWAEVSEMRCGWYVDNTVELVSGALGEYFALDTAKHEQMSARAGKLGLKYGWDGLAPHYLAMYEDASNA